MRPDYHHTTSTPPARVPADVDDSPAAALAAVVVVELPQAIQEQINTHTVRDRCERLAALGWTPEPLEAETRKRGWSGAGPGAVIDWLSDLGAPTQPASKRAPCTRCSGAGFVGEDDKGRPIRCECRRRAS